MCTKEREAKCRGAQGPMFGLACKSCIAKRYELSEYFFFVWRMYKLSTVRYPFDSEAFSLEVWDDLAAIKEFMETVRMGWRTKQS